MSFTPGQGATIVMNVDGANASVRDVETVGDALRKLNANSLNKLNSELASVRSSIDGLRSNIGDVLKTAAAGLSVGAFVAMIKGSIDAADGLNDLSKSTNIAVADLAGLRLASQQSGGDLDSVAASINKLSVNMGKDPARFAKLGVAAKEPLEAFKQFADVFKAIQDPQAKAALAAEAIGKSWAGAAPLLSEGGKRIGEMVEKGKAMSQMTQEIADRADEFNDNMAELSATTDGFKTKLASDMLPALIDVSKALKDAYEESGLLNTAWRALGALGTFAFTDEFKSNAVKVENLRKELGQLQQDLDLSKNAPAIGYFGRMLFGETTEVLETRVANVQAQIKNLVEQSIPKPKTGVDPKEAAAAAAAAKQAERAAAQFLKVGEEARKAAAAAAAKEATAYAGLIGSINERIVASQREAAGLAPLTEYQKLQISLNEKLASGQLVLTEAHKATYLAKLEEMGLADAAAQRATALAKIQADYAVESGKAVAEAAQEARANEDLVVTFGMTKAAIEQLTIARLEDKVATLRGIESADDEIAKLEMVIAAKKRNAAALGKLDALDKNSDVARARDLLEIMGAVDDAARDAASGMTASFGTVGSAIGGLTTALTGYGRAQAAIAAQLKAATKDAGGDTTKIQKANAEAAQQSAQAQIRSYGNMAGAAKGFFKQNSTGYKTMEGAEKAFRAVEMAMAIESMLTKSGLLTAFTGIFVASKATEEAVDTATTGKSVINSGLRASADGIAAFAKTLASVPFPYNIAAGAAVLALLAGVGVAVAGGGSGSDTTAKDRQAATGTGTVFGDSTAKSDSIARSLGLLAANSSIELSHTAGMLRSLRVIESSIGGLTNLLVRSGSVSGSVAADSKGAVASLIQKSGSDPGTMLINKLTGGLIVKISDKIANALFGGKVTTLDTGITAAKTTVAGVMSGGIQASQYTDTKKDGGIFRSDKYSTQMASLGAEANDQFSKAVLGMVSTVTEAGKLLGVSGDAFTQRLSTFAVDLGKISVKDMKPEEYQKQLEAAFSKVGDDMAKFAVGGLVQFQKVGEGYFETLTRVAADYANLDSVLTASSMTFGAVGLQSITMRERLIDLAGGISDLAGKSTAFTENFMTEAERLAPLSNYVQEQMAALGLASVDTREKFKQQVLGLKLNTVAGQDQYVALMDLADAFAKTHAATVDLTLSEQAIQDQRKDLQNQWDELTMTAAQLQAKARLQIDPSNRALFDQIALQRALKESTAATSDALKSTVERLASAKAGTIAYRDSLVLGTLSTLTPMQKYLETQRQYSAALSKANLHPDDSAAQSSVQSAATAFLTASQLINASSSAYVSDKSKVLGDMTTLAAIAGAQMSDAQLQLSRLDAQVSGIATLNQTAVEIVRAIQSQPAAAVPVFDAQRYAAAAGTDALVTEVKALREQNIATQAINAAMLAELKLLRADAERQSDGLQDATEEAGRAVVEGVGSVIEKTNYAVGSPTRVSPR